MAEIWEQQPFTIRAQGGSSRSSLTYLGSTEEHAKEQKIEDGVTRTKEIVGERIAKDASKGDGKGETLTQVSDKDKTLA